MDFDGQRFGGSRPVDETSIRGGFIRRDYRRLTGGFVGFSGGGTATVAGSFEYKDPLRTLFFNGSISRSWNRARPIADRRFIGEYIVTLYTAEVSRGATWSARAGASKGVAGTKGTVELETLWSRSVGEMRQNGVATYYASEVISVLPSFKGRLAQWCNAEYSLSLSRTSMSWRGGKSATRGITQRLSVTLIPSKKFFITLSGEHYATEVSAGNFKNLWLADVGAKWRPAARWELSLSLSNLFDRRDYTYTLYGPLSSSGHFFRFRPREVLTGASFRF